MRPEMEKIRLWRQSGVSEKSRQMKCKKDSFFHIIINAQPGISATSLLTEIRPIKVQPTITFKFQKSLNLNREEAPSRLFSEKVVLRILLKIFE